MSVRLLIVDDETDIRELITRHFSYLGYETDVAENGAEALQKLKSKRTDIVISDIVMPKMDGVALLKHIRDQHTTIPVIIITGYVTLHNLMACMRYGATTCVFKPLHDLNELQEAVEQAVQNLARWQTKLRQLRSLEGPARREPDHGC